jgi:alpha-methylacyl-CoA racemase
MTDGSALLMAMMWGYRAQDAWRDERGVNLLDTGAPFYETYETADGGYVALGSIEPQFYALLRAGLDIADDPDFDRQDDQSLWPMQKLKLAEIIRRKTRSEWCAILEGSDACFTPVLKMSECLDHPHNVARGTFITVDGVVQPAPAPRYSVTPCDPPRPPRSPCADQEILAELAPP